jgi:hypothetical protein
MTVPVERTNAVIRTQKFLLELLDPKKTPRVPRLIRQDARNLLRHYPTEFDMNMIADREDGVGNKMCIHKIFGKSYL